jgi:hypothetical protein
MSETMINRSDKQNLIHIGKLRAELHEFGLSIVSTEWLNGVFKEVTAVNLERIAREKAE